MLIIIITTIEIRWRSWRRCSTPSTRTRAASWRRARCVCMCVCLCACVCMCVHVCARVRALICRERACALSPAIRAQMENMVVGSLRRIMYYTRLVIYHSTYYILCYARLLYSTWPTTAPARAVEETWSCGSGRVKGEGRESERQRDRETERERESVCVYVRERDRERESTPGEGAGGELPWHPSHRRRGVQGSSTPETQSHALYKCNYTYRRTTLYLDVHKRMIVGVHTRITQLHTRNYMY
jgi:hypothetical protein